MNIALCAFQLPLTHPGGSHIWFRQYGGPGVIRLGARQKSNKYGLGNIYAKYDAFGRIWTKHYIYCPNSPDYVHDCWIMTIARSLWCPNNANTIEHSLHFIPWLRELGLQELWVEFGTSEHRRHIPLHILCGYICSYLAPYRGRARYCNAHVCLFVCLCVCLSVFSQNFKV